MIGIVHSLDIEECVAGQEHLAEVRPATRRRSRCRRAGITGGLGLQEPPGRIAARPVPAIARSEQKGPLDAGVAATLTCPRLTFGFDPLGRACCARATTKSEFNKLSDWSGMVDGSRRGAGGDD